MPQVKKAGRPPRGPDDPPSRKTREAMDRFCAAYAGGTSKAEALRVAERSEWTFEQSWKNDAWFIPRLERALDLRKTVLGSNEKMPFVEFREKVLGRITYPHMQQWADWFQTEDNDHVLILCPPESAKTTFVIDFILWLIYLDPTVRVGYASKSLPHAIKQVSKIKNIIEQNKAYQALCGGSMVPGPGDPHPWTASHFTVAQREWTAGEDEADYTCAAFGAGSQITGSRFDLLVFDDPDDVNVGRSDREKIWNVILQAGESRLGTSGRMVIIGNRQDEEDVYRLILDQQAEDPELWAIYTQKAIQEEDSKLVIWPEKFGLPKKFKGQVRPDGPWTNDQAYLFFDLKRRRLGHRFNLVYQNDPLADRDKDFTREMVDSVLDVMTIREKVPPGAYIICSMDPAPVGGAAVLVYALLPPDNKGLRRRQVIDMEWGVNWRHVGTWERLKKYTEKYHPRVWVMERSATTRYLLDDPALPQYMAQHRVNFHEVSTGVNKEFGDYAVSSLRELFLGDPKPLILPGATSADRDFSKALRDQLVDYHPDTTSPHDCPMALWFAERAIRDLHLYRYGTPGIQKRMGSWVNPYNTKWAGGAWSFKPVVQSLTDSSSPRTS